MKTSGSKVKNRQQDNSRLSEEQLMIQTVVSTVEAPVRFFWWILFAVSLMAAVIGLGWSSWRIASEGVGVLGLNNQIPWGLDIVHFVFWIGLGHAGTLISSVLLLTGQHWRSPIARGAELMTLCAVCCAAIFPVVHVGRIWMMWMVAPLPGASGVWPDPASPLFWDVLAVSTYFLLSIAYWYIGLLPDFAVLRDQCRAGWRRRLYGLLCLGWQGSGIQWGAYERTSVLLAAVLAPLVVSVHSVVSFEFAVNQQPGWHESIFPVYFVAGAILSGMAMVQLILVAVRMLHRKGVGSYISGRVLGMTGRFVLGLSLAMAVMYFWEHFCAILNGGEAARAAGGRMSGTSGAGTFYLMLAGNILLPQLFWWKRLRRNPVVVCVVALFALACMLSERWLIVVESLQNGLMGVADGLYSPSMIDIAMGAGSLGLFAALYMALMRMTPFFSLCEMRSHLKTGAVIENRGKEAGS